MVLANTALEQAAVVAERVRKGIADHDFSYGGGTIPVTVSLGVATIKPGFQTGSDVYQEAGQGAARASGAARTA